MSLSLLTLNILSPCYKRLGCESRRESDEAVRWRKRHSSLLDVLLSLDVDLICLQEFWFDREGEFARLYESRLSADYSLHSLRRTNGLDDGLAIGVRRKTWKVKKQVDLLLNDVGNRVALLLHLQSADGTKNVDLINVHLTFPHHQFDLELRLRQIRRFVHLIDEHQRSSSLIFCGDFNSPHGDDPVYQLVTKTFESSYVCVHGREVRVTHLTHRGEEVPTDFIFFRSKEMRPISCQFIPQDSNEGQWTEWHLSDHRGLLTRFHFLPEEKNKDSPALANRRSC